MTRDQVEKWQAIAKRQTEVLGLLRAEAVSDDCVFARAFVEQMMEPLKRLVTRLTYEHQDDSEQEVRVRETAQFGFRISSGVIQSPLGGRNTGAGITEKR